MGWRSIGTGVYSGYLYVAVSAKRSALERWSRQRHRGLAKCLALAVATAVAEGIYDKGQREPGPDAFLILLCRQASCLAILYCDMWFLGLREEHHPFKGREGSQL